VTLIVASLTSVILPSGLIVTSGSRPASIKLRAYWAAACSAARWRANRHARTVKASTSRSATPREMPRLR